MSDRLHVATRKGLFTVEPDGRSRWRITRSAFLGDPVTLSLVDPRDRTVYAALNLGHFGVKLHRSTNAGESWEEIGVPAYPGQEAAAASNPEKKGPSLKQIWSLEPGGADQPGVLWAGTIPGGLFRSPDRGATWQLITSLWERPERKKWMGGGYDEAGIHSICVDPRDSSRVAVAVSIGGVWLTENGGDSWELRGKGMVAAYMPPERRDDPSIQDPHRMVQCPAAPEAFWVQHHNGVFLSRDGGRSFVEIDAVKPSVFGFGVAVHPRDPETAWLVPAVKDECRIPVDGQMVVTRTRDGGKNFEVLREGLPQEHAYDLVYRHALDVDETGDRLAMGSTTGSLWISEDQGDTWHTVSGNLPPVYSVRFEK